MVTTAKVTGGLSTLFPKGVTSVEGLPNDLAVAIAHALRVLSWHEGGVLRDEDIPPQWMWHLDWEIDNWFKDVKKRQQLDSPDLEDDEDRVENEFAARFRRR